MNNTITLIEKKLHEALQPTHLSVTDDRAAHRGHLYENSGHYTVEISATALQGKKMLEQHRLVYQALGDLMQTHIHALQIRVI